MPFFGACYSPYHRTGARPPAPVSPDDVAADMALMKKLGITHIRTYSASGGNEHNVYKASDFDIAVSLGVWIDGDGFNAALVDEAISQADSCSKATGKQPVVDLVIGNEVNRKDDKRPVSQATILKYMTYAKQALATKASSNPMLEFIRVTSCFSGTVLSDQNSPWVPVVDACGGPVFLTVYPWYAEVPHEPTPDNIKGNMDWSWNNGLKQVIARGKTIVIAEIGWPSAGGDARHAPTSVESQKINYETTKRFLSGKTASHWALDAFWFEMFDEPWKTQEGPWGPHWGLCTAGPDPKPKFEF